MKILFVLYLTIASAFVYLDMEPVVPNFEGGERIINGKPAEIDNYPYQVGLSANIIYWCGGYLLAYTWVITAAHCVDKATPAKMVVYLDNSTRASRQTTRVPTSKIIHPQWNSKTMRNDIALLQIPAVGYTHSIRSVALPPTPKPYSTYNGVNSVSSTLQYASLTVISNKDCIQTFGSRIQASNICVKTPGGISTWKGDSGGPLVTSGTKTLIGLTSFGLADSCTKGHPVAFTRITSCRTWILNNTGV